MPTNFVPRNTDEGTLGTSLKRWLGAFVKTITIGDDSLTGKATDDEASEGTVDDKWITPAKLKTWLTAKIATTVQAVAGTDDATVMTPAKVKAAIDNIGITWQANHVYSLGQGIIDINIPGCVAICSVAGTTGTAKPSFGTNAGTTVTDGTVSWIIVRNYYLYDQNLTTGYKVFKYFDPNTGSMQNDIHEWGIIDVGGVEDYAVTLPIAFNNTNYIILLTIHNNVCPRNTYQNAAKALSTTQFLLGNKIGWRVAYFAKGS